MRSLAWLKNHCLELVDKGMGHMHPHISAAEVLVILGELEGETPNQAHPGCDQCQGTGYVSIQGHAGGRCSCPVVGAPVKREACDEEA
jgi:hypothetical protein